MMAASIAASCRLTGSTKITVSRTAVQSIRLLHAEASKSEDASSVKTNMARLKPHLLRRLRGLPGPVMDEEFRKRPEAKWLARFFKTEDFNRRMHARYGRASGVDLSTLWPDTNTVERELAKLDFQKPLSERIDDMKAAKQKEKEEIAKHQALITERMSKMGQYMEQHHKRKQRQEVKNQEQIDKRNKLLEEAREFFGYEVHHKDLKFQQMMEWKEEEEKKAKKLQKRQSKDSYLASKIARMTAELKQSPENQ